ncbi:hypothetical protein O9G_003181 [Rozella allomycis CSF55]|uniref:C2 domain-containing protein n=1 Tax=Rozella allomycis (strain CSF55) TaxID=988480 RepID=A0A075AV04_ROZAC|nr:hypothetical protein O9G_003181 [Rozella allomycis CSF55]|eukprot:EPZ34101.1 hypothetical protein O9G_003181 [Rozella allomycis CSF55]
MRFEKSVHEGGVIIIHILEVKNYPKEHLNRIPYAVIDFDKNDIVIDATSWASNCPLWNQKASLLTEIVISLYAPNSEGRDFFLGSTTFIPDVDEKKLKMNKWCKLSGNNAEPTTIEMHIQIDYQIPSVK